MGIRSEVVHSFFCSARRKDGVVRGFHMQAKPWQNFRSPCLPSDSEAMPWFVPFRSVNGLGLVQWPRPRVGK